MVVPLSIFERRGSLALFKATMQIALIAEPGGCTHFGNGKVVHLVIGARKEDGSPTLPEDCSIASLNLGRSLRSDGMDT